MRFLSLIVFLFSVSSKAAVGLNCEAWKQNAGSELVIVKMIFFGVHEVTGEEMFRANIEGVQYKVDLNKQLDTLYATIVFGERSHLFSTMRIPDLNIHNDAFLDFTSESGDRASISCNVSPVSPSL